MRRPDADFASEIEAHIALEAERLRGEGMSVDDAAYARLVRMHAARRQTPEAAEGLASFAEKRAAKWGGKT